MTGLTTTSLAQAPAQAQATAPTGSFVPYSEEIPGTSVRFQMVPIAAGSFQMGSPDDEKGRKDDEGPRHWLEVGAFWMGAREVTWDEYDLFRADKDAGPVAGTQPMPAGLDVIARPTPAYADESFGFGKGQKPVISITHHAAMEYCRWVSKKTGRSYRLPTEAEWEYACRAGTSGPYPFAATALADHAWSAANSNAEPQPVGRKRPNVFGLFDMNGNVAEWVLDHYDPRAYAGADRTKTGGVVLPTSERYPDVVRGGSWDDEADRLRCAARQASEASWSRRDPQRPQSIWWHTNATTVGFRIARPMNDEDRENLRGVRSKVTRQSP